jgi:hypothetical protein
MKATPIPDIVQSDAVPARGMWSKLRIPVLIGSTTFLLLSMAAWRIVPQLQEDGELPSPLTDLIARHDMRADQAAARAAYAARLRTDAARLAREGDYENALVRLDQAATYDERGDMTSVVQEARQELRTRIAEVEVPHE